MPEACRKEDARAHAARGGKATGCGRRVRRHEARREGPEAQAGLEELVPLVLPETPVIDRPPLLPICICTLAWPERKTAVPDADTQVKFLAPALEQRSCEGEHRTASSRTG